MEEYYPLSFLRSVARSPDDPSLSAEFDRRVAAISSSFQFLDKAASFFYLFDFVQMRYLYCSESIRDIMGGFTARDWIERGPEWVLTRVYHEDVRRLMDLHKALFDFYYALPVGERLEYKYGWECRLVRKDEKVIWLMQQGSFIEVDREGRPMLTFDTISETTHHKKDNSMTLTMFRHSDNPTLKLYFPITGSGPFTKREIELIKLLSDGYSSKEIAEKLFISPHTVDTHRRNMLKKSGTKDSSKLVVYARENGLI
jgi:DNA-binding CsgD family transcriptional regulator